MAVKSNHCPNCNGPYDPASRSCAWCGSYLIETQGKEETYDPALFQREGRPENYQGIYVYGILLDPDEYPIRMGAANYKKSALNAVGGHLLLTNKRVAFISHALNIGGKMQLSLPLGTFNRAEEGANMLISQTVHFYDQGGKKYTFVVYGGPEWAARAGAAFAGRV